MSDGTIQLDCGCRIDVRHIAEWGMGDEVECVIHGDTEVADVIPR